MRIGIDVDETLTDTEISFNEVIKKYNIKFDKKYSDKWSKKEAEYLLGNFCEEIIGEAKLKKGAKEAIKFLKDSGHELFIITARNNNYSKNIEDITRNLMKENNLEIDDYYFNQNKKSGIAKKLNIDLMIDDNINVYNNMKKVNIDCILFGDEIKNWKDVLKYIERKNNG